MSIVKNIVKKITKNPVNTKLEDFGQYGLGLIKDPKDSRDYKISSLKGTNKPNISSLPNKVDYSNEMSSIKDQDGTPMCVGFAVAAVREWQQQQEYITERKEKSNYIREEDEYDFSDAWIYWNCKKIDNFPNSDGTSIRAAMKVLNKIGVPQEKAWPFSEDMNNPGEPESWSKMTARWNIIKSYHRITNLNQLLDYLANHGPVVTGVLVFKTFYYPDNKGHVNMPNSGEEPLGGHGICLTGYDKDQKKIFFKNSWSTKWGDQGFGSIPFKYWKKYSLDSWALTNMDVSTEDLKGEYEGM